MRFTTISSSITTVVARAFGFEVAGDAVRTLLHHSLMREPLQLDSGYQPEPWPAESAFGERRSFINRLVNSILGKPELSCHQGKLALAVYSNPTALAATSAKSNRIWRQG